jgi:hypothetical protein
MDDNGHKPVWFQDGMARLAMFSEVDGILPRSPLQIDRVDL